MTVGDRIRYRRKELKMTMDELGAKLGVQRSAVNKYEKNKVELKVSQIKAVAEALDVSVFYLLDDIQISEEDYHLLTLYHNAEESARQIAVETLANHQKKDSSQSAI